MIGYIKRMCFHIREIYGYMLKICNTKDNVGYFET